MSTVEKLRLIQAISGITQTELARKLGVTFVALNRWINGKSRPRPGALLRIDALFSDVTGIALSTQSVHSAKKEFIALKQRLFPDPLTVIQSNPDICDQVALSLTYNTNSIEGSTFSEADTAVVLFHNGTVPRKSLREHLEVSNHLSALHYLLEHVANNGDISEALVHTLHSKLMNGIRDDAGQYRTHAVRIVGTHVPTANAQSISGRMSKWIQMVKERSPQIVTILARTHADFEQIHPFSDGNGRVGRLLMLAMALRAGFSPLVITVLRKTGYMSALNKAQMKEDYSALEECVYDALIEGYKILERKSR